VEVSPDFRSFEVRTATLTPLEPCYPTEHGGSTAIHFSPPLSIYLRQ